MWGGDPDCGHVWRAELKPAANGMVYGEMQDRRDGGPLNAMSAIRKTHQSGSCDRCGGWQGEHGLEPTIDLYIRHVLLWSREVRRVLRSDGTFWLNMGDCFYSGDRGGYQNLRTMADSLQASNPESDFVGAPNRMPQVGLKDKDLVGMPWRIALALQADGWWLRSDIIWSKPNPMPESVTDRPTRAHEYLFLMAKSERYFYDADAIREPFAEATFDRILNSTFDEQTGGPKDYGTTGVDPSRSARRALENLAPRVRQAAGWTRTPSGWDTSEGPHDRLIGRYPQPSRDKTVENPNPNGRRQVPEPGEPHAFHPSGRNKRTVWEIPTVPYPEAHFTTFPQALVLPCILAGAPTGGIVLDPFCGSGTVLEVAAKNGRDAVGIELQPDYVPLMRRRLSELETDLVNPTLVEVR
jgi:DNA modification methylase